MIQHVRPALSQSAPARASARVVVLGGGLAGIVAALDLADAGVRVTLLEVRPRLGGAAYSFERDDLLLDNGQHVFLRCCTAYRALLERLGSSGRVHIQPRLEIPVLSPGAKAAMLRRGRLPAPLHLAGALLRYPHLGFIERLSAARAALALARLSPEVALRREQASAGSCQSHLGEGDACPVGALRGTLGEWLAEHGQSPASVAALWDLIALPTLNLPAAEGSLALGAFVLRTGLLERADAGDIGFHMRPLGETLGEPAERALAHAGVEVRLGVRVERADQTDARSDRARSEDARVDDARSDHAQTGAGLRVIANGAELEADAVVCALPHSRAASLLQPLLGEQAASWRGLGESPIVNVHVVYDRRVSDLGFAAGVGTPAQYVFDRTGATGLAEGQCLAISLSGAVADMKRSGKQLRERHVEALAALLPRARDARVLGVYVSREHAATFRATPGVQALRPAPRTRVPGLVLAGAWTDTGWPATLEGAVLSGHAAARELLGQLGSPPASIDAGVPVAPVRDVADGAR